jgi:uncharacterized repeat protein (TIGR01451 family)
MKQKVFTSRATLTAFTLATLSVAAFAGNAQAANPLQGTAGNAVIRNSGAVTYNDARNNPQATQYFGVDVTVLTVAAAPTVTISAPASTDGTGATATYSVTVRTNSNGPGTFSFSAKDQNGQNIGALGAAPAFDNSSFTLGSTIYDPTNTFAATGALAQNATLTIKVPHDGTAGGSSSAVNGLTAGTSTVYVTDGAGQYYGPFLVSTVNVPALPAINTASPIVAVPTASVTLTAQAAIPSFTPAAGWMIVEQKSRTVQVTQGTVTDAAQAATWDTQVDSAMTTGVGASLDTPAVVTTTAHQVQLSVKKYSRNVGTACTTGNKVLFNTNTYCDTGVSGKPSDKLEYLIVVSNAGTGLATAVKATDQVPLYTTLLSTGADFATIYDNNKTPVTAGTGSATIGYGALSGTSMSFDLGNPSVSGNGGTIPQAVSGTPTTWYVTYQVTIN